LLLGSRSLPPLRRLDGGGGGSLPVNQMKQLILTYLK
jgi:hypothetical protein